MYEHVLLPTDGSGGTDRAIEHALELASTYDASLHVLTVVDDGAIGAAAEDTFDDIRTRQREALESIADRARSAGLAVESVVREGTPHREILEYVDAAGIDLVVMGTHGRSGVGRVLLGSVTERVVRAAPVPVVTVRVELEAAGVATSAAAADRAREALAAAGHDDVDLPEDPYRTTTSWVVPATTDDGTYNVHIDAVDGSTRLARLDG